MDWQELAERRRSVMVAAADRWESNAPRVEAAAELLESRGRLGATSDPLARRFLSREVQKPRATSESFLFERVIGGHAEFDEFAPSESAEKAGRPVARIGEMRPGGQISGFATGFLIAPDLLTTNWHVFSKVSDTEDCCAQFGYENNHSGGVDWGVVLPLDASKFFLSDKGYDISIVGVDPQPVSGQGRLEDFGVIELIPDPGKYLVGNPINIIQHPDGLAKRWAVTENGVYVEPRADDLYLEYRTDTRPGSSGSPAFNHDWELVALHHSGVPRRVDGHIVTTDGRRWSPAMPDDDIDWVANEGIRISKIYGFLKSVRLPDASAQSAIKGVLERVADVGTAVAATSGTPNTSRVQSVMGGAVDQTQPVSIVVTGTANFYFGSQPQAEYAPPSPSPTLSAISEAPALPSAVGAEKALRFDPDYGSREGFLPTFLPGFNVPHPTAPSDEVLKKGNRPIILTYHHYSLAMHEERQLAMWTASNVNYAKTLRRMSREEFGTDTWKADPRIPNDAQLEDLEFYAPALKFDRGHLVRRDDVAWGKTKKEEEYGNSDSFHWTNCSPQHEGFNRDMFEYDGLWGQVENLIKDQAHAVEDKLIVFAGPVLNPDDPVQEFAENIQVQVPMVFWKVVVVAERANDGDAAQLGAYGFLLDQTEAIEEYGWEGLFRVKEFAKYQVTLHEITELSRVRFPNVVSAADRKAADPEESGRRPITSPGDIRLY